MERNFVTADAVTAILAYSPVEEFRATPTELQAAFRRVATEFPQLLDFHSFGKVGAYVGSDAVEAALDSLAAAHFYSRFNKDLVTHRLHGDKLRKYYDTYLDKYFDESHIKKAAQCLIDTLNELHSSQYLEDLLVVS